MYYIGVRDGKKEKWKKKAKINHSILVFFPTIYLALLNVYIKVEDSGSHWSQDFCDAEREKWTNKGNDKQEEADSFLHNTNIKILSAVVPEKSLVRKRSLHTHKYGRQ